MPVKLNRLNQTIHEFEQKWGMNFEAFKQKIQLQIPDQEAYSFDTETDFWQWEEAVTLKEHLTSSTKSV